MADSTAALSEDKAKLLDMSLDEIIQESGEAEPRQVERVSKTGGISKRRTSEGPKHFSGPKKPPASRAFREWRALATQTTIFFKQGGDLAIKLYDTDVAVIKKSNDVCLSSGGFMTIETLFVMNEALKPMSVKVTETNPEEKEWSVSDNSLFQPFKDNMTLKPTMARKYPPGTCASLVNQVLTQAIYTAQDHMKREKKKRHDEMAAAARPAGAPPGWVPGPAPVPFGYPPPAYGPYPAYGPPPVYRPAYPPPAYYRPGMPPPQYYPPHYPQPHDPRGPPEQQPPSEQDTALQNAPKSDEEMST